MIRRALRFLARMITDPAPLTPEDFITVHRITGRMP